MSSVPKNNSSTKVVAYRFIKPGSFFQFQGQALHGMTGGRVEEKVAQFQEPLGKYFP